MAAGSCPWRLQVRRPFSEEIDALVVEEPRTGVRREIAPPTSILQPVGERSFRRKSDAQACVDRWRAVFGADVVSDVYRAGA